MTNGESDFESRGFTNGYQADYTSLQCLSLQYAEEETINDPSNDSIPLDHLHDPHDGVCHGNYEHQEFGCRNSVFGSALPEGTDAHNLSR